MSGQTKQNRTNQTEQDKYGLDFLTFDLSDSKHELLILLKFNTCQLSCDRINLNQKSGFV